MFFLIFTNSVDFGNLQAYTHNSKKEVFNLSKILTYYKNLPKNEWNELRKSVSWVEYIIWWIIRILMIHASVQIYGMCKAGEKDSILFVQICATTLVTFAASLFRIIFPKQIFLGRLPYSAQKYATACAFFCSYFGHYHDLCAKPGFDTLLHIMTGFLLVFACYEIVMSMQLTDKPVSGFIASVIGFGMNCFVIILWEIFEFTVDYIGGGNLQAYIPVFSEGEKLIFKIFGDPATQDQLPVFDTMLDMMMALVSSVPAAALLWVKTAHQNKKREALQKSVQLSNQPQSEETETPVCV